MEENNKELEKGSGIDDDVVMVVDDFKDYMKKESEKKESKPEADKKEADKKEADKKEADKKEADKKEADKKEADKKEADKKEADKKEADKKETDKKEADKKEADKKEADKKEADKKEPDKKESDKPSSDKVKNNAVSQSKKIEDAKKANENVKKQEISKPAKTKSAGRGVLIGLSIVACLILVAYIGGFVYFSMHFYQDVAVNGINVSNMNKDSAKAVLDNFYKSYNLTLTTIDNDEIKIMGNDIAASVKLHDEFSETFRKQQPALWFVNMLEHHDYTIGADATWDEGLLEKKLSRLAILDKSKMIKPENAYVGVVDGKFDIIKEVKGTTIKTDVFNEQLHKSLSTVQSKLNLVEAGCYELPTVYADNEALVKDLEAKNEFAKNIINIQMDDLTLEPGMELYENILEKSGDKYSVSKTKVTKYVNDLAAKYDTMNKDRTFVTSFNGKTIKVNGKAFGYELDKEATTQKLYDAINSGKSTTVEAQFISKGKSLKGDNDIGDTYVEVNLSEQRVIAYKNGRKIAEGDCVSGNESLGHGTTPGLYEVQDKLSPTVLRGEKKPVTKTETKKNKKGKKVKKTTTTYEYEYESPVTYWLQFNGGQGLHDAAGWRSAYGGSIYYYSGSHGCVNLPLDLAKTLYQNIEVGDPVIVYFWDNAKRK